MCEYCEKGTRLCQVYRDELGIELDAGKGHLIAYGLDRQNWDISVMCNINYCPMCGKALIQDRENEKTFENEKRKKLLKMKKTFEDKVIVSNMFFKKQLHFFPKPIPPIVVLKRFCPKSARMNSGYQM